LGSAKYICTAAVAFTALLTSRPPVAWAQGTLRDGAPSLEAQADRIAAFDIPAQPLAQALTTFGRQSGLQIAVDTAAAAGKSSPGVTGSLTHEEALRRLLAGSGLTYRFTSANAVTVGGVAGSSSVMQLDPVRVQANVPPPQATIDNLPAAYPGGQVARGGQVGLLGERDVMNTPFNQSSYTSTLIENQQARSVADVALNDPSIRNNWPAVGYNSALMIRGFQFNNYDLAFGGLYGVAPPLLTTPEYLERVEILKGPSAMLNGMPPFGSIGGAVNLIPKRAPAQELNRVTANYGSSAQFGGNVDFARRFGDDGNIGVRFTGVYRNGSMPVDRQTQAVGAGVFGLDFRGERLRASLDYGYQTQTYNSPSRATYVQAGIPVPLAPGGRANWFQPWTFISAGDLFGATHLEYDITPDWTVFGALGARWSTFNSLTGFATVISANGNLLDSPLNFPGWSQTNTQEVGVRGRADTGPIRHAVALTGTRIMLEGGQVFPVVTTIRSNLYQPTFVNKPNVPVLNPPKTNSIELSSLALADVVSVFDERIQFIVGGRYQRVQIGNYSSTTGAVTSYYDQSAFSPAVGFVIKPWENVSLYGNYIQGLQQGPTAPAGTQNAGQVFAPVTSKQVELGTKVDFGQFTTTLSLFQIEQPFGITNPTTAIFSVGGTQRNQGLELQVFGEPLPGFRALGGISLINGRQLNTGSVLTNNLKATGVPDVQLNLNAEWDAFFLRGLTFSGRVIYTSLQYLDAANTQSIPSWTRFDAGVRYVFDRADGKPIALRFNVENVFDLNYWASAQSSLGLAMGGPRTFLVSLTADF
jgi:iron complex outermembrane receptor protein